jgi:VCBS repeat-containing protein
VVVEGFELKSYGSWSFDASHAAYERLQVEDAPLVLSVPIVLTGGDGVGRLVQTLVITLQGSVTGTLVGGVTQVSTYPGDARVGGQIVVLEQEGMEGGLRYRLAGPVPGLELEPDGAWLFDPLSSAYGGLKAGERQILQVPVLVEDATRIVREKRLVISLLGTNNHPVVGTIALHGAFGGGVRAHDRMVLPRYTEDGVAWRPVYEGVGGVAGFTLDTDGAWAFDASQFLEPGVAEGTTFDLTLPVVVRDEAGVAKAAKAVCVELTATTGAPALSVVTVDTALASQDVAGALPAEDRETRSELAYAYLGALPPGFQFYANGQWSYHAGEGAPPAPGQMEQVIVWVQATGGRSGVRYSEIAVAVHGTEGGWQIGTVLLRTLPPGSEPPELDLPPGPESFLELEGDADEAGGDGELDAELGDHFAPFLADITPVQVQSSLEPPPELEQQQEQEHELEHDGQAPPESETFLEKEEPPARQEESGQGPSPARESPRPG